MCVCPVSFSRWCCGRRVVDWAPCGKCEECKKDKQNEYVVRTLEEAMKVEGQKWFWTLTFAPANVPLVVDPDGEIVEEDTGEILSTLPSLDNSTLTAWKKRCKRKLEYKYGRKYDFSYLFGGEYGPLHGTPHYHGVTMGMSREEMEVFKKDWEEHYGFVDVSEVRNIEKTARYVAKYITKLQQVEHPNVLEGKVEKPRKVTSVGYGMPSKKRWSRMKADIMGKDYTIEELKEMTQSGKSMKEAIKLVDKISKNMKYKSYGKEYKLPAYYKKKMLYSKDDEGKVRATEVCRMVTHTLVRQVQSDFSRKLVKMANEMHVGEDRQGMYKVARHLTDIEATIRENRARTILETNIAALKKSIF